MRDEDGVMSLDFLAGFTIFLLALIMVVSMVPGLLAGLGSSSIDYDAVAYRTGVILAEDPGWPAYPPWEMAGNPDEIERMGFSVSRETPNVLLSTKIERFFDSGFTAGDYRSKAIFGDYPYSYNISIRSLDGAYQNSTGEPLPPGHGYIRRVVKIKEPGAAVIDGSLAPRYLIPVAERQNTTTREFTVRLDLRELLDPSIGPAYRIDPRTEPVSVTIRDFDAYLNGTASDATLTSVRFWKMDTARPNPRFTLIPFSYEAMDPNIYTLRIDGEGCNLTPNRPVTSSISFVLKPEAISRFTLDQNSILDIRFTFDNKTNIGGTYLYNYENATPPPLKPAVLEVAIW
ncbi:hypothetical protein [Methanoculleus thermophilus]|uniref:Uncharacterized protein n=1 Tax=Methanoculleus thermophilus TaxID=2200 RepID=A0A1G9BYR6_9EURY|nr:hypothetical protein [Methanoculleus thermophilus]SDK44085.1 hypothetical protein SAMN04488571_11151 [Methanoculleus thermophilus]